MASEAQGGLVGAVAGRAQGKIDRAERRIDGRNWSAYRKTGFPAPPRPGGILDREAGKPENWKPQSVGGRSAMQMVGFPAVCPGFKIPKMFGGVVTLITFQYVDYLVAADRDLTGYVHRQLHLRH